MKLIKVPKPPASAMNKDRPISSLLKTQLLHVQKAEFRLPARAQTNIYIMPSRPRAKLLSTSGKSLQICTRSTQRRQSSHGAA